MPVVLPDFLVIGAEKAATTWLARSLGEHPDIFLPPEKELFFFSTRFDRGIEWYAQQFRLSSGEARVGEATPVYLSHPEAAERIRVTLSNPLLLVSLRHPVDRAYSAFWHNLRHGRLPPDSDFGVCLDTDACEIRSRGDYWRHLARYVRRFPRERLLVLQFDDIQADPGREFRSSLEFLSVDSRFRPTTLDIHLNEGGVDITTATGSVRRVRAALRGTVVWARHHGLVPRSLERAMVPTANCLARQASRLGSPTRRYRPLHDEDRAALMDRHYHGEIDRLEELLEIDLSRWRGDSSSTVS